MRGVRHFVIHVPETHNEVIETESGVVLYADKRHSENETINTVFQIVETPLNYEGPIKKGWWILVDPTMIFEQTFENSGTQTNEYLLDKEKCLYKVDPSLIVCFRKSGNDQWQGFNENVICERLQAEKKDYEKIGSLYVPEKKIPKSVKGQMVVVVGNENLDEVGPGDIVFVKELLSIPIKIEGKSYQWLRNKDVLAKNTAA